MSTNFCITKRKTKSTRIYYVLLKSRKELKRSVWERFKTESNVETILYYLKSIQHSWVVKDFKFKIIKEIHTYESDTYDPKTLMLQRIEWGI